VTNTITVTLVSGIQLAVNDVVTISGLSSAVTAGNTVSLVDAGDEGETKFSNAFVAGSLRLTVLSKLVAGTQYTFKFDVTNPSDANTAGPVSIAASGSATITSTAMSKPGTALFGVTNGADPLMVVFPSFSIKSIEQSTPVSSAINKLTVTLTVNYDLKSGSTVTILGLTGSQTADNTALAVTSTNHFLGTHGAWTKATGKLVLTVAGTGTVAGSFCEVTFALQNTAGEQASPTVHVAANIHGSTGTIGVIASGTMTKPGTSLFGLKNGADPLRVLVPFLGAVVPYNSTSIVTMVVQMSYNLAAFDKAKQVSVTLACFHMYLYTSN